MKKNLAPLLIIAFAVAIVATGIFYGLVANRFGTAEAAGRTVVVAVHDLAPGAKIRAADLKSIPWAGPQPPSGAYSLAAQVEGMTVLRTVHANQAVVEAAVASAHGGSLGVPSGMRAISAQVSDSSGVLAMLKPGHRVEIGRASCRERVYVLV